MEEDRCYTVDCSKADGGRTDLSDQLRSELLTHGYVKVKCENIPARDCDQACLNVIAGMGGVACPYNDDRDALIWPVKVLELDTPSSKLQASQLDRELVFHTDCSYEDHAPGFVALYVVQCDRSEHGGKFQMVRTREIIERLSDQTKRLLRDETYKINVPPDFPNCGTGIYGSILLDGDEHIRYRRDIVNKQQLEAEGLEKQMAIAELNSVILAEEKLPILRPFLENNMMVMFNNARFVHGRTRIEDIERYFLRVRFNLTD